MKNLFFQKLQHLAFRIQPCLAIARQMRQSPHIQQKWVWQTISSWSQFATLNDHEG
jgi:hypothetical protein